MACIKRHPTPWRTIPALLALAAGNACARSTPKLFELQVSVMSEGQAPVAGAQIRLSGSTLGSTNALGRATFHLPGKAGDSWAVSVTCPDGFRTVSGDETLVLPDGAADAERVLKIGLSCELELSEAVVLVHATGDTTGLPVKVDGVVVGHTDALGFAHVHVQATPRSQFEVSLDTSTNERLSPPNPAQRFRLEQGDELFVLEANFDPAKAANKQRRAGKRRRTTP